MKKPRLRSRLWARLFASTAAVLVATGAVITVCNSVFLTDYYIAREKDTLRSAERSIEALDLSHLDNYATQLQKIENSTSATVELRDFAGNVIYSSLSLPLRLRTPQAGTTVIQLMPSVPSKVLSTERLADGSEFQTVQDVFQKTQYLVYAKQLSSGYTILLRVERGLLARSAAITNQFVLILLGGSILAALLWTLYYTRRFTRPIVRMSETTKQMAALNFSQKLEPDTDDEVGDLGRSINFLSDTLDGTLTDLKRKNEQLSREIEMVRTLEDMRREFVANVSHELKTPIAIIQGYAEGLRTIAAEDREMSAQYTEVILDESGKMSRLVLDLLDLSHYETGHMSLSKSPFQLEPLVASVVGRMKREFEQKRIEVDIDCGGMPTVDADQMRTEQVLKNYLSNAIAHSPADSRIAVAAERRGGSVRVHVRGVGEQVSDEDAGQIWESFYRADKSHNRDTGRYGLGLSIVRAIQELHGQACGCERWEGGMDFWFDMGVQKSGGGE